MVSSNLDPDQDRHSVGLDLGPNYFQRLSADLFQQTYFTLNGAISGLADD